MGSKSKKILKVWVFALSMIFAMALALGITGAAYNTARDADGTLTLNQGIVIDYTGFGKAENGVWESETTTTFKLFADSSIAPGATINLNAAGIKKGTNSIDYFVRIKFDYKFYDANNVDVTTTVGNGYSAFISTPSFASAWVDGNNNDGWFYYATGTTLNALPSADYVSIFPSNSAINVELNAEGFNHAGGGYKFSNEVTIAKVEAILTLQALQTTGATWEIIPAVIENSSSQVIQINSNEITLGNVGGVYKLGTGEAGSLAYNTANLGTTLKIVVEGDSQINANAFDGSNIENIYIGDADYIAGVSSYSAKIYSTPATFIIGANAFKGCSNLNIYLTSNINYLIYKSAISEVSHIYYDGNDITSIIKNSSDGYVYNTITMTVSTVIPGGNVSSNSGASASSGLYQYIDSFGNIWRFNVGAAYYSDGVGLYSFVRSPVVSPTEIELVQCGLFSEEYNQTVYIPESIVFETLGPLPVTCVCSNDPYSIFGLTKGRYVSQIIVPSSVKIIKSFTFANCESLTSVTLNEGLLQITGSVFRATPLEEINIPNSVEIMQLDIFEYTKNISTVNIPNNLIKLNESVRDCGKISSFVIDENTTFSTLDNGRLLTKGNELVFCASEGLTTYTIPNSITSIGNCAFPCSKLTSITIPSSVTSIGSSAFVSASITSITIPNSVSIINDRAFQYCTSLHSVTFEDGGSRDSLYIGHYAFDSCSFLNTVNWGTDWTDITVTVGEGIFNGCTSLSNLYIPNQNQGE